MIMHAFDDNNNYLLARRDGRGRGTRRPYVILLYCYYPSVDNARIKIASVIIYREREGRCGSYPVKGIARAVAAEARASGEGEPDSRLWRNGGFFNKTDSER